MDMSVTLRDTTLSQVFDAVRYVAYDAWVRQRKERHRAQPPRFSSYLVNRNDLSTEVPLTAGAYCYAVCVDDPKAFLPVGHQLLAVQIMPASEGRFCVLAWCHPMFPLNGAEVQSAFELPFEERLRPLPMDWYPDCPPGLDDIWPKPPPRDRLCPRATSECRAVCPQRAAGSQPVEFQDARAQAGSAAATPSVDGPTDPDEAGDEADSDAAPGAGAAAPIEGSSDAGADAASASSGSRRRRPGAPMLKSTIWLEGILEQVTDLDAFDISDLYTPWALKYAEDEGDLPRNTWSSFKQAVEVCKQRIKRRRQLAR